MRKNIFFDSIKLNAENKLVEAHLILFGFEQEGLRVIYSPALDIYGYGEDEAQAKNSFQETIDLYLDYVHSNGTLIQDLYDKKWSKSLMTKQKYSPKKYDPLLLMSEKGISTFSVMNKQLELA